MSCECCLTIIGDSAATCVSETIRDCISKQISYVLHYGRNVRNFNNRASELNAWKQHVEKLVNDAEEKGEEIKPQVHNWQQNLRQIESDVHSLEAKLEKQKGCCHIWYLDLCSRRALSKDAKNQTAVIEGINPQGKFDVDTVSYPARPAGLEDLATSDFVPLETSSKALNSIMELLKDDNISIIGVHGRGGIGKTTLMEQLVKQVDSIMPFDKALVTVAESSDLRRIQDEIAKFLKFEIDQDNEHQRRATLSKRLKARRKKVLIILDDLREKMSLSALGVPYGAEYENRGCKVIVTSRRLEVCSETGSNKNVEIGRLNVADGVELFKKKAALPDSNAFDAAAKAVVEACKGLPLAITVVGGALRNKPVREWDQVIKKVAEEAPDTQIEEVPREEFQSIEYGYNELQTVAKLSLQFCCLFPSYHNVSMEDFVIYGLVDRLFPEVDSFGEVWNKMHSVIEDLKRRNLLMDRDKEGLFRVHDNVREVVKYFASKEGTNLIAEAGLKEGWPKQDLQECKKISLMNCSFTDKLPKDPKCPQLLTLFLPHNALGEIPSTFFENMRAINFLDLSYTNISKLPGSLECLEDLRALRLENTQLRETSLNKEFRDLEVLLLKGSSIQQLPKGLETWSKLKLLDVSNNLLLEGIPPNVISKLTLLEELYVGSTFGDWEVEGAGNEKKAKFSEVASLNSLTALYIHVKNTKILATDFDGPWRNLKKFRICVNDDYWDIASKKSMHLKNLSNQLGNWVKYLLEKTENLTLTRSRDLEDMGKIEVQGLTGLTFINLRACNIQRVFSSTMYPRVENLEELHVEYCYSTKEVFNLETKEQEAAGLTRLRVLIVEGLPKLNTIWKGSHSVVHLENLKLMKVKDCQKLESIFPKTLAHKLNNLEQLSILYCDSLEEIVSDSKGELEMNFSKVQSPVLFQNLQKLTIAKCNKMASVFPLTIFRGLDQLEELKIVKCNELKTIISVLDEERAAAEMKDLFPKLKILALLDLPGLETLFNHEVIALKWSSLEELQVWNCSKLTKLPLDSRSAPNLKILRAQSSWFEELQCKDTYSKERLRSRLVTKQKVQEINLGSFEQ